MRQNYRRRSGFVRLFLAGTLLIATATLVAADTYSPLDDKGKAKAGNKSKAKAGNTSKAKPKSQGQKGSPGATSIVRADVLQWVLANNPGLRPDFLRTELPGKTIKLPDGQTLPIYRLKQFHDVNFRLTFFARNQEKGSEIVPVMETRLRKLMCLPDYYEFIMKHRGEYKINGKKVSALQAYNHFRYIDRRLGVTAGKQFKAPVGGGSGIAAPSWAVWKAMNIFHHEACHCIGINHDSGGLSGPLSGALREWDRKKKWNYSLVDLNTLVVRSE